MLQEVKDAVPFADLRVRSPAERAALLQAIGNVLDHGKVIDGPEVALIEERIEKFLGVRNAVGVSSGTDALYLAIRALGIEPGSEVIVPALSWIATAHAISVAGGTPVFADIGDDLNISCESILRLITPKTRAVIAVHFMGNPCDMDKIQSICRANDLFLIEDAAQAFGARINGRYCGTFGNIGCFSMNPMKILNALGEAGMVVTDDPSLERAIRAQRYCGVLDKSELHGPSLNFRMDTMQAAILMHRLNFVAKSIVRRSEIAKQYQSAFDRAGISYVVPAPEASYYGFTLLVPERPKFMQQMKEEGVETKIQHVPLMCDYPCYLEKRREVRRAARLAEQIINVPNHEHLTNGEVDRIIQAVIRASMV